MGTSRHFSLPPGQTIIFAAAPPLQAAPMQPQGVNYGMLTHIHSAAFAFILMGATTE